MTGLVRVVEADRQATAGGTDAAGTCFVLDFAGPAGACEPVPAAGATRRFLLGSDHAPVRAAFAPFALVRAFVDVLLAERPRRVVIDAASGAAMELARLAAALGFAVALRAPATARIADADEHTWRWLQGLLAAVRWILPAPSPADEAWLRGRLSGLAPSVTELPPLDARDPAPHDFGYAAYALGRRDHGLLLDMQAGLARHFEGCARVLDAGCGTGVFLEVLARRGIAAVGVERNAESARYARSLGHEVVSEDALVFLQAHPRAFDGIYCSHFIEHLPVEAAERLMRGVAAALTDGGVAVFVFPDPESIRSQLLGFWRDPEHVRFYHPELVETLAAMCGLELTWSSLDRPDRRVVPFGMVPPLAEPAQRYPEGRWARLLRWLGVAPAAALAAERARGDALEAALRQLWAVNQTWAWDDNAVLCFTRAGATVETA